MNSKIKPSYPSDYSRTNQINWLNQACPNFVPSITITGLTAVGKTATVMAIKRLLDKTDYRMDFISVGDLICEAFSQQNYLEGDKEILIAKLSKPDAIFNEDPDDIADKKVFELGQLPFQIIDGRIPHSLAPLAFHVLLDCPYKVRAERRTSNLDQNQNKKNFETVLNEIKDRDNRDFKRYQLKRPGAVWNSADFDIICSTHTLSPDECANFIVEKFEIWCDNWKKQGRLIEHSK